MAFPKSNLIEQSRIIHIPDMDTFDNNFSDINCNKILENVIIFEGFCFSKFLWIFKLNKMLI